MSGIPRLTPGSAIAVPEPRDVNHAKLAARKCGNRAGPASKRRWGSGGRLGSNLEESRYTWSRIAMTTSERIDGVEWDWGSKGRKGKMSWTWISPDGAISQWSGDKTP